MRLYRFALQTNINDNNNNNKKSSENPGSTFHVHIFHWSNARQANMLSCSLRVRDSQFPPAVFYHVLSLLIVPPSSHFTSFRKDCSTFYLYPLTPVKKRRKNTVLHRKAQFKEGNPVFVVFHAFFFLLEVVGWRCP